MSTEYISEVPVACTLTSVERSERGMVVGELFAQALEANELADGYRFRFPGTADLIARVVAFVMDERPCCPFLAFSLSFEANEGPVWLYLRGPEGTKGFIEGGFLAAFRAGAKAIAGEGEPCRPA